MRGGEGVEHGGHRRASIIPHRAPRRRRRQHADPPRRLPRRGAGARLALRDRARVDRGRARRARCATCSRCATSASATSTPRSSPRPCRSCARSGPRWPSATSATRCRSSGPGVRTGMPIRMDNPREVGADRLVNAVAAYERVGGPCVVVDFGTAITYDCVGAAGEYVGGIIAPGVEISMEALTSRAAAIPKIDLTAPRALIGKSTVEAIRSGVIYGFAAQVDGIVAPAARGAGRGDRGDRHRRPRERDRAVLRARSTTSTSCSRSPGLRLICERNIAQRLAREACARSRPWELGGITIPNRVVLAPLAGIGNWFVRLQAKRYGAGPRDLARWSRATRSTTATARRSTSCSSCTRTSARAGRSRSSCSARTRRSCAPPRPWPPRAAPT